MGGDVLHADDPGHIAATCTITSVSLNVMEKVLLKIKTHESRTRGQPDRDVQPGWIQVTYSWSPNLIHLVDVEVANAA